MSTNLEEQMEKFVLDLYGHQNVNGVRYGGSRDRSRCDEGKNINGKARNRRTEESNALYSMYLNVLNLLSIFVIFCMSAIQKVRNVFTITVIISISITITITIITTIAITITITITITISTGDDVTVSSC